MKIESKIICIIMIMIILFTTNISADNTNEKINSNTAILYVDDDANSSWYDETHVKTIQEGINNATTGDTVFIYSGLYVENVFVNKTINLIGQHRNNTIIDGGFLGSTIVVNANESSIENVTVRHGGEGCSPDQFAGIRIVSNNNTIKYNIIKRDSSFGLSINASNNVIFHNWIYGNCGEGIFLTEQSFDNIIYNNVILDDAIDNGFNQWNVTKTAAENIIGGPFIGGNYWDYYQGIDSDLDGIGDTQLPYNASGNILNGGDFLPLLDPLQDNQSMFNRGFPIRAAIDGDWAAAQSFYPKKAFLSKVDIYLRKFGSPEFNLTIELREESVDGNLSRSIVFEPSQISSEWQWLSFNFNDFIVPDNKTYFIVVPPAPDGIETSFGYEWGYAFGNQYDDGSFWFTRDGGNLWRDLPNVYEFCFKTYGFS